MVDSRLPQTACEYLTTLALRIKSARRGVLSSDFVFRNQHGKIICRIDVSWSRDTALRFAGPTFIES